MEMNESKQPRTITNGVDGSTEDIFEVVAVLHKFQLCLWCGGIVKRENGFKNVGGVGGQADFEI